MCLRASDIVEAGLSATGTGCSALGIHKKSCEAAPEAFQALNRTSKSLGQCLPVTKNEFRSGAKAMPFKTSW